ncbi:MAG TPA: putative maltokinase, partial [Burkholderiales bacterium]|nr:putative maltokinase [Burkholderiales bacterium]
VEIMQQTPEIPESAQWAIFLRNHDELTLEMVTSRERDYMYRQYAADTQARINLGIRRRLAPLMENDSDRIRLMNSLLLSMPGSPIIYYGDEIGMGDNIYLGDRNGVRTPMQWSPDRNAGFSRADPQKLYLPPIMDPVYGYDAVNVESQMRDPSSQLNWMKRMLATRATSKAFGRGKLTFLRAGNRKILSFLRETKEEAILCVANLARTAQPVELELKRYKGRVPVEMLGRTAFPPIGELPYMLTLPAHAFYWFRLATDATPPDWHRDMLVREEAPVMVLFDGWTSFFRDQVVPWRIGMAEKLRAELEGQVLPRYVEAQRWYAAKGEPVKQARIVDHAVWQEGPVSWLLAFLGVSSDKYFVPLALAWEDEEEQVRALAAGTVARIRQQANVGLIGDALADEAFCRHVVKAIGGSRTLPTAAGKVHFAPTRTFGALATEDLAALSMGPVKTASTNTSVQIGERFFLKCYRRLRSGMHPELEIGRFLTEVAQFPHCVPLAGSVEYVAKEGGEAGSEPATLMLLQAYLPNQGDGWQYTLGFLQRYLESAGTQEGLGAYLSLIQTLGVRTAELHRAFTTRSGDPAFEPEPFTAQDAQEWKARVRQEAESTFALLKEDQFDDARKGRLLARIASCAAPKKPALKTRHHGDYHLGQVLLANNDFVIIDFEGEPGRTHAESRRKRSPLRDVAGMLRSFSYARWSASDKDNPVLDDWEAQTRRAFLGAYGVDDDQRGLLALAEIEKLLYELRYELANRPDWIHVPLRGALGVLGEKA